MPEKYTIKPIFCHEEPTPEVTTTLNYICTLFHGYEASGIPIHDLAPEFYKAVGTLLDGSDIRRLDLEYLEIVD